MQLVKRRWIFGLVAVYSNGFHRLQFVDWQCPLNIVKDIPLDETPQTYKTRFSDKAKYTVVIVRHGQSEWNDIFCGWYDADLSIKGLEQAHDAGVNLKQAGYEFDVAHTSVLTRAQKTLWSILQEIHQERLPVQVSWRLNERHYGDLTGKSKEKVLKENNNDEEKVRKWRRGYDNPPPAITPANQYYKEIVEDPRYKDGPSAAEFPKVETLKTTMERVVPYWNNNIVPQIKNGKRVLIVAHGTSVRALVKHLSNVPEDEIMDLNIPNGIPIVYEFDEEMNTVVSLKFLADEETVKKEQDAIAAQGKAKKSYISEPLHENQIFVQKPQSVNAF
ncbi:phosphoglycerate mutase 1-like isoform X2 [Planococcus citri]|uniref:phosphoglycerate mutase 1-like isoform X2 n=1 Tax=Planococcus citri TaxID=170843 RepID=UPI0031F81C84